MLTCVSFRTLDADLRSTLVPPEAPKQLMDTSKKCQILHSSNWFPSNQEPGSAVSRGVSMEEAQLQDEDDRFDVRLRKEKVKMWMIRLGYNFWRTVGDVENFNFDLLKLQRRCGLVCVGLNRC